MEAASEFISPNQSLEPHLDVLKAVDELAEDPLKTPLIAYKPHFVASTLAKEDNSSLHALLTRKIITPLYRPDQLAEMSPDERAARLIDEEDVKKDLISGILGAAIPRNRLVEDILQLRSGLKESEFPHRPEMQEMNTYLREELEARLPVEFNDILAESVREYGVNKSMKLSVLQSFKELYEQDAQNKARQAEGLYPEKIQRIDPRLVTEKFNLVFSNDSIYGQLREALFDHADQDGQARVNNAVKVIIADEVRKAQEAGQEIKDGDLAPEVLRFFQAVKGGAANPEDVKYLLDLTHDMTNGTPEMPSKPSDLAYMAAKVLLNETQDIELSDQAIKIALRAVEMVFSENTDEYLELENNGSDKGKLLVFVESFFKKRRHDIESSVQNADLTSIDKLFATFTEFKNKKMGEQREKLVGMLKTEAVNKSDEVQIQEREGYPDEIIKMKKGMLHDLMPVELLETRLRPIIGVFG